MWLYYNFFQPVMRLKEKTLVSQEGQPTRVRRRHDLPRTPFHRLCITTAIPPDRRRHLTTLQERTNPRQLRTEIQDLIIDLFALPNAEPGSTQNVYHTLAYGQNDPNDVRPVQFSFPTLCLELTNH
jgi:hypothetical protein